MTSGGVLPETASRTVIPPAPASCTMPRATSTSLASPEARRICTRAPALTARSTSGSTTTRPEATEETVPSSLNGEAEAPRPAPAARIWISRATVAYRGSCRARAASWEVSCCLRAGSAFM